MCQTLVSGCSRCTYGNYSSTIGYDNYIKIADLNTFNTLATQNNWRVFCLECLAGTEKSALKYDYLCYLCSSISQCSDCLFLDVNGSSVENYQASNAQVSGLYEFPLDIQAKIQIRCLTCISGYIPDSTLKFMSCKVCSSYVANCNSCSFGFINNMTYATTKWDFINPLFDATNLRVFCLRCQNQYGLNTSSYSSCTQCSSNCETCYMNGTTFFCGRCANSFALVIDSGTCQDLNQITGIPAGFLSSCSHIISSNPWKNILNSTSNYLCQKCTDPTKYPSIMGICQSCTNNNPDCSLCYEADIKLNYTDTLMTKPLSLKNNISLTTNINQLEKCLACKSNTHAFDANAGACCSPTINFTLGIINYTTVENCDACGQCTNVQGIDICSSCTACRDQDPILLADLNAIQKADPGSELYAKRIYYILKTEAASFGTTPTLNDTATYETIFNSLTSQKRVDLASSLAYTCTPCMMSASNCVKPQKFIYVKTTFNEDVNLNTQLSYQLLNSNCRPGFIYDNFLERCKFCPNKWTSCDAHKRFVLLIQTIFKQQTLLPLPI